MANDGHGVTPGRPPEAGPEPSPEPSPDPQATPTTVVRSAGVQPGADPRRILWRDSATILVFVVLGLLGLQAFLPRDTGAALETALPSTITIGSLPPGVTLPPGATFGEIVDPSLGIDATPTPIPVITLGPSPSPSPSPSPTAKPTPKATPKPSGGSTPRPTVEVTQPPPTDTPAPPPAPTAAFSCTELAGLQLSCTDQSTGSIGSWAWTWGDGEADTGSNPPTHTYATDSSPVTVRLTVAGPGGGDFVEHTYTLIP